MHVHLPKPLHGWREFAGEVGIIVLGVLIALGAEQLIQTVHSQREVTQFRSAVDLELATTLAAYRYRVDQEPCVKRRLGELRTWLDASRAGKPLAPPSEIGRPSLYSFLTSVWKSSSPNVMNNLSLVTRERYAGLYDFAGLVDGQLDQEAEIWRSLNAFNGASQLSSEDRSKIADLAYRAKSVDDLVVSNYPWFKHDAAEMGIAPAWGSREVRHPSRPCILQTLIPRRLQALKRCRTVRFPPVADIRIAASAFPSPPAALRAAHG